MEDDLWNRLLVFDALEMVICIWIIWLLLINCIHNILLFMLCLNRIYMNFAAHRLSQRIAEGKMPPRSDSQIVKLSKPELKFDWAEFNWLHKELRWTKLNSLNLDYLPFCYIFLEFPDWLARGLNSCTRGYSFLFF